MSQTPIDIDRFIPDLVESVRRFPARHGWIHEVLLRDKTGCSIQAVQRVLQAAAASGAIYDVGRTKGTLWFVPGFEADEASRLEAICYIVHDTPGRAAGEYAVMLGLPGGRVLADLYILEERQHVSRHDGPTYTTWGVPA